MRSYIKAIIIFDKDGNRKIVPFKEGVNIITGESKTGKSALVEIIDYCLCSSRCTVPKGKITDFAYLYVMPMLIDKKIYILARSNWQNGGKMFFIEENIDFSVETITLDYFNNRNQFLVKEAQKKIESALGLHVTNVNIDKEEKKKASLRNMVSYLFQHQNLMASKFALFYRFTDFYKRKEIIDQFPIFAGMIGQEYYSDLIELGNLKSKLKSKQNIMKDNEKSINYIKNNLQPMLQNYYALLDIPFDTNLSADNMLKLAINLPNFDDSFMFNENGIVERYDILNEKLESLRDEERELLLKIGNINNANKTGSAFINSLSELKKQTEISQIETSVYSCPICGKNCEEIIQNDKDLLKSSEWLDSEISITSKYTFDFSEDIRKLNEMHKAKEDEIKVIWKEIKNIEQKFLKSKEFKTKKEKVNYSKSQICFFAEISNSGLFGQNIDEEVQELKNKIKELEGKIDSFNLYAKKKEAERFLSNNMNRLSKTLDFEEEFKPINLKFDLIGETFDIYQEQQNGDRIYLYEMGSGANWISCHIALFLSFLHYFSLQKNSPMPLIMFFDQPSQAYFPQSNEKDDVGETYQSDLKAVNQIYKTIFDEIKDIENTSKLLPQIIIVDHVDGNNLEIKNEFKSHVRAEWRDKKALI